eukprot:51025-Eustigmatos_ZCMA.PRE.1
MLARGKRAGNLEHMSVWRFTQVIASSVVMLDTYIRPESKRRAKTPVDGDKHKTCLRKHR